MTKNRLLTKAQKKFFRITTFLLIFSSILIIIFLSLYLFGISKSNRIIKDTPKAMQIELELQPLLINQVNIKDIFEIEYLKPSTNYSNQITESKGTQREYNRSLSILLADSKTVIKIIVEDYNSKNQNNYLKIDEKNIQEIAININPKNCNQCPAINYKVGLVQSPTNKNELVLVNIEDRKILLGKTKNFTYNTNFNLLIDKSYDNQQLNKPEKRITLSFTIDNNSNIYEVKQVLESLVIKN